MKNKNKISNEVKKRIYLDHAATTYLDHRVKKAMDNYWIKEFGNPGAIHYEGRQAKKAIENSRKIIADIIGSRSNEIIFTSGGTDSNNLAILGVAGIPLGHRASKWTLGVQAKHIITAKFEHHSVLEPCRFLEKNGFDITYLDVNEDGIINPKDVKKALKPETVLVSIMYANNEIGTVQPIVEIGKILKKHNAVSAGRKVFFHTDACQASPYLDMNASKLGIDLMSVNGSKMYGPKGIGFLYIKKGIKLTPIIFGGGQEKKLKPGTENVPAIVGLAESFKISQKEKDKEVKRLAVLRDYFIKRIISEIPKTYLNGNSKKRLPNNINVSIIDIEGESIVLYLDEAGISCSTGSACTSDSLDPSHVIMALGKPYEFSHGSIRFSLGKTNTKKDIDYVMKILPDVVKKLRGISPLNI